MCSTVDVHIRTAAREDREQIRASPNTYIQNGEWVIIFAIKEKAFRYFKSLQARIFVIFILVGMTPIFLMEYVILKNYVTQTVSQKRSMIQSQCQQLVDQISQSGYVHGNESTQVDKQMRQLANLYNGRLIVVNSNFRIIRDTFEIDEDKVIISEEVLESFLGTDSSNSRCGQSVFGADHSDPWMQETKEIEGILIVSVSTEDVSEGRAAISRTVWILQLVLSVLICAAAFYVARILTRPFGKIYPFSGGGTWRRHRGTGDLDSGLRRDAAALGGIQPHAAAYEAAGGFQAGICLKCLPRAQDTDHWSLTERCWQIRCLRRTTCR